MALFADNPEIKRMTVKINFWFEWGGGCLWPADEATINQIDFGPYDLLDNNVLALPEALISECRRLAAWHNQSLNWEHPPDPGPWRQQECDTFNSSSRELFKKLEAELKSSAELIYKQVDLVEDPDLDQYLKDPKRFRREQ